MPYYIKAKDPTRDHDLDNRPYRCYKIGGAICCCRIAEVHIALWPAAILWKHPPGSSQAGTAGEHWAANAGNCGNQPGNLQEKGLVLRMLEQPEPCNTALEAVEGLRRWSLWRTRATTIGMAEPDASVLVRGLDRITNAVIQGSGELSFRVSLIRSTLQVDVSPSASTVTSFLQHLQAEMEQQARLGATRTGGEAAPSLKAITTTYTSTPNPSPDNSTSTPTTRPSNGVCKFFAGDRGCRRGNTCRFPFWKRAPDPRSVYAAERCLTR